MKNLILYLTIIINLFNYISSFISLNDLAKNLLIADGTLWCGKGSVANDCDHLGDFSETDKCCREHDMCPYVFSTSEPNYNGFMLPGFHTISHCECDKRFHSCLHEKPYKENSFYIWSSYESIQIKCFAYLPCSLNESNSTYKNIWSNKGQRRTGSCFEGFRVMLFDTIFDYMNFMNQTLSYQQHLIVRELLVNNKNIFLSIKKKNLKCYKMFEDYPNRIVNYYKENFINRIENSKSSTNELSLSLIDNIENLKFSYITFYLAALLIVLLILIISFILLISIKNKLIIKKREQNEPLL